MKYKIFQKKKWYDDRINMEYRCEVEFQNQYLNSLKKRNVMLFFWGGVGQVDFQAFW